MPNTDYLNQYEKENLRQIRLKINRKTEPELLEWIEKKENIQGYIKRLILEDMEKRGGDKMKINNLKHQKDGSWTFRTEDNRGTYYTNANGEGLFFQSDRTGETKQLIGTCQFSACETASGMRRKIEKILGEEREDPRI